MKVTVRLPSDSKAFAGIYDIPGGVDEIDFVANEKGLDAIVGGTKQGADMVHMNLELTRDEAATIWYALEAYKDQLKKDLDTEYAERPGQDSLRPFGVEDEMFLGDHIAKVARLMFEMHDDHDPAAKAMFIQRWMDV